MPRPRSQPSTALGLAVVRARAERSLMDVGAELGLSYATLSSIERGAHRPTYETAVKLAGWLGWTVEQVMTASKESK